MDGVRLVGQDFVVGGVEFSECDSLLFGKQRTLSLKMIHDKSWLLSTFVIELPQMPEDVREAWKADELMTVGA